MNINIRLFLVFFLSHFSHAGEYNSIGIVQHIGARHYQEDRYDFRQIQNDWWFGVYDGHGGDETSNFLASSSGLAHIFSQTNQELSIKERMEKAFAKADEQSKNLNIGSTASVVYIKEGIMYFAHVGDSRAMLLSESSIFSTSDHKPDREDEKKRIEGNAGTIITRENDVPRVIDPITRSGLAMSRAIGDQSFKPWVISLPEYTQHVLNQHANYLIIGSDGLYDDMAEEMIAGIINRNSNKSAQQLAQMLVNKALNQGAANESSIDNITALVIDLKKLFPSHNNTEEDFHMSSKKKITGQRCTCNAKIAVGITLCSLIGALTLLYQVA